LGLNVTMKGSKWRIILILINENCELLIEMINILLIKKGINSYLCNKLGNVIFSVLGMGFLPCTEKMDLLRIAHMIFSIGIWKKIKFLIISKLKSGIKILLFSLVERNN
jgi:hypothetical protein